MEEAPGIAGTSFTRTRAARGQADSILLTWMTASLLRPGGSGIILDRDVHEPGGEGQVGSISS